ncbi:MAG: hypothetical protein K2H82_11400, partial [Oscillospiraceae bacterium]|nr:hypothetical protein [Oscillospiraceae bacterium]
YPAELQAHKFAFVRTYLILTHSTNIIIAQKFHFVKCFLKKISNFFQKFLKTSKKARVFKKRAF